MKNIRLILSLIGLSSIILKTMEPPMYRCPCTLKCLVVFFTLLLSSLPCHARWRHFGEVGPVVASGTNLIAGSWNGIFISKDSGASWKESNGGLDSLDSSNVCFALFVDGKNIYAGSRKGNVFLSVNAGETWVKQSSSIPGNDQISSITLCGGKLFAGAYGGERGGVFVSADNGKSWTISGLDSLYIKCLTVSGTELFAGTGEGVFRFDGKAWAPVNTGLSKLNIQALASKGKILFALAKESSERFGLFVSANSGANWKPAAPGQTASPISGHEPCIAVNGSTLLAGTEDGVITFSENHGNWVAADHSLSHEEVYYLAVRGSSVFAVATTRLSRETETRARIFLSQNNGKTWTRTSSGLVIGNAIVANGTDFLSFSGRDVLRSTDNGVSWAPLKLERNRNSTAIPAVPRTLLAVCGEGQCLSIDYGLNWTRVPGGRLPDPGMLNSDNTVLPLTANGANVFAVCNKKILVSPDTGRTWNAVPLSSKDENAEHYDVDVDCITASGSDLFAGSEAGVFHTADNGANWTQADSGLPDHSEIQCLAASGSDLYAGSRNGVFRSVDKGEKWAVVNSGLRNLDVRALAAKGKSLFAGTHKGIFLSTDCGGKWVESDSGLSDEQVRLLVVHGTNILAGTSASLFSSANEGKTWRPVKSETDEALFLSKAAGQTGKPAGSPRPEEKAAAGKMDSRMYYGILGHGVFISTSMGATWSPAAISPQPVPVAAIGKNLFAGIFGGHILRSTDNGASWALADSRIPGDPAYFQLSCFVVKGTDLFAAYSGKGIFVSKDDGASWQQTGTEKFLKNVMNLTVCGKDIFALTNYQKCFISSDDGTNWTEVGKELSVGFTCLAQHENALFAGTSEGIVLSTDRGKTWKEVGNGLIKRDVHSLAINGANLVVDGGQYRPLREMLPSGK
jgi:photosystem II stability/assembly factor-like uncharacterized protein